MKTLIYIIILFSFTSTIKAQNAIFLSQGRIEFEKKISLWAIMDEQAENSDDASWAALEKKIVPQFKTTYFDLEFDDGKTLYKPGRENPENNKLWQSPAEDNVVFTNLKDSLSVAQKHVYEQTFLVNDSTRKIKWKITDETRNIAGFDCRRANAIIMDSIYVVAFYTDEITTTGGPESFNGLPGMILGVALPHEHITWFATKVYTDKINDAELTPPAKGKKTTSKELLGTLQDFMKDWGNWSKPYQRQIML
ncbi:MAG TPA: GLPGLI family protein [Parafilimonas sp.]|nr:GLPGLI family protein [Parafilimonas sp.]